MAKALWGRTGGHLEPHAGAGAVLFKDQGQFLIDQMFHLGSGQFGGLQLGSEVEQIGDLFRGEVAQAQE